VTLLPLNTLGKGKRKADGKELSLLRKKREEERKIEPNRTSEEDHLSRERPRDSTRREILDQTRGRKRKGNQSLTSAEGGRAAAKPMEEKEKIESGKKKKNKNPSITKKGRRLLFLFIGK